MNDYWADRRSKYNATVLDPRQLAALAKEVAKLAPGGHDVTLEVPETQMVTGMADQNRDPSGSPIVWRHS